VHFAGEFALIIGDIGEAILSAGKWVWKVSSQLITVVRQISAFVTSTVAGKLIASGLTYAWKAIGGSTFTSWLSSLSGWLSKKVFNPITGLIETAGTKLAKMYGWASSKLNTFLRALGPLVAAAAAAASLYTFIKGLIDGDSELDNYLNGALAAIAILELIVSVAALFVTSVILTAVGVVLALAAIIITLVQLFNPPPPPPSPVDVFQNNTFFPWLSQQETPPADWTPPELPPDDETRTRKNVLRSLGGEIGVAYARTHAEYIRRAHLRVQRRHVHTHSNK